MRKFLAIALTLLCFVLAFAASTSYKFPTTTTNTDYSSGVAWTNPNNVQADDASVASVSLDGDIPQNSDWIYCTGFGFTSSDIPAGSTIDGIIVEVVWTHVYGAQDMIALRLINGGVIAGDQKTGVGNEGETQDFFGSGSDKWGLGLVQSNVTASNFGVAVRVTSDQNNGGTQDVTIDYIRIQIAYTAPATGVRKQVIH